MVYYKKKFTKKKKTMKKKPVIKSVDKRLRRLEKKDRDQHQYLNYVQGATQTNITQPFTGINLCDFNSMTAMFGAGADDETDQKIIHSSFGIDGYISLENLINDEENTIQLTMFLVSLKDQIGSAFNPATSALTLSNTVHYYSQDGLTMLNKKVFNIHKVKRLSLTNHNKALADPSAQTQHGTDYRFYWKWRPNQYITNPLGNWKSLGSGVDPSKTYYLLIFNNNSTLDLESPAFTYNVVHTMKTCV